MFYFRRVESSTEEIEKTLVNFRTNGFINYYGLQRFGSYSTAPTYEIGKCLISKQWKEVRIWVLTVWLENHACFKPNIINPLGGEFDSETTTERWWCEWSLQSLERNCKRFPSLEVIKTIPRSFHWRSNTENARFAGKHSIRQCSAKGYLIFVVTYVSQ